MVNKCCADVCIIVHKIYIIRCNSQLGESAQKMLRDYEEELLLQLYDNGLIAMRYCSIQKAADITKWQSIMKKYGVKKSFLGVLRKLTSKGYVDFHGKSGDVVSLSRLGVFYVKGRFQR